MLDLVLAIAHHLIIFAMFGVLAVEVALVRRGLSAGSLSFIGRVDLWYGALAGLIVIVGFTRAIFAAKGWAYYSHNMFFWAKIGTLVLVGLLSIPPTMQYMRWRNAVEGPTDDGVGRVRRFLVAEVILFAFLPVFAAAMARGYGEFS